MDFFEDDDRPRILLQARNNNKNYNNDVDDEPHKLHIAGCFSFAAALLAIAYISSAPIAASLLVWFALSLIVAPFAPSSVTGGNICVGNGEPIPEPSSPSHDDADEPKKRFSGRRNRSQTQTPPIIAVSAKSSVESAKDPTFIDFGAPSKTVEVREGDGEHEWSEEELNLLKKQIVKHPAGEPRRWEKVSEAFMGRHGLDSVISMAKSLSERRPGGGGDDSFQQFLKNRKPIDKRMEGIDGDGNVEEVKSVIWSSGDDIALLNAMKAFPKDVSMRWEKIAAAVPGKSKAACMKRITELKRDFRSSKANEM